MPHSAAVRLEIHEGVGPVAAEWDALVANGHPASPFLWSWWLTHVTEGEAVALTLHDQQGLVGGLALQRDRVAGVERLRLPGTGGLEPDHFDVVARDGRHRDVTSALATWLRAGDRLVDLDGVAESSALRRAMGRRAVVTPVDLAPYAILPATFEEYLAGRRGQTRSTVARSRKRLEKEGVRHQVVDSSAPVDLRTEALDALARLHDGRWGEASALRDRWAVLAPALRAGLEADGAVIHLLRHPEEGIIAVEADLLVAGRVCFYQAGRLTDHRWRGSGSVLKAAVIEHAIAAGRNEYDLLRGDEPYKEEWATSRRPLFRVSTGYGPRGTPLHLGAEANRRFQVWRVRRREGRLDRAG